MALPDRIELMNQPGQTKVTGIDFVYVFPSQTTLDVFFLKDPAAIIPSLVNDLQPAQFRIESISGGESIAEVPVTAISWQVVEGRNVARLTTATPGDFSYYRLRIEDNRIDQFFNGIRFSFKANCPSDFDCKAGPHDCPPEPQPDYAVNYLARDYGSLRQALLDFASERYPDWRDRLEPDTGVMLVELMAALGDEMAYYQDRVSREGYLETATQRRSVRRLARLVDYEVHDGLGASTWLDFQVAAGQSGTVPARFAVRDRENRIAFETGVGLFDPGSGFSVDSRLNELTAHIWDKSAACLPAGATDLYINADLSAVLPAQPDKWMLLFTRPTAPSIPIRKLPVRVVESSVETDSVEGVTVTHLVWDSRQATPFEMDMETLVVHGNLVRATAGETFTTQFRIGPSTAAKDPAEALERQGPHGSIAYLFSLPKTEPADPEYRGDLVWRGSDPRQGRPEIRLFEAKLSGNIWVESDEWHWQRSLLGVNSSLPSDKDFTLDDGTWRRVLGVRRIGAEIVHRDYATGDGTTIRFGDDEFGLQPPDDSMFQVHYRLGNGRRGNVAPDTLVSFNPIALPFVDAVTNPLASVDGIDPETIDNVRSDAPQAFRAITYRAVRPEDYAEAVERLPWVQRAGAAFRWTGSWLTCFVTPDPRGSFRLTEDERIEAEAQLDRFRQAGREAYLLDPVFANIDLEIVVCVEPGFYPGDVKERTLEALFGSKTEPRTIGFFSPDNFTFGTPLERSAIEAAIQRVPGVRAVERMRFRRRGWFDWRPFAELVYPVATNEIVRIENLPDFPERGSVRLLMEGGA
jgi:hypothetical protein